jgi:hypothetical protein
MDVIDIRKELKRLETDFNALFNDTLPLFDLSGNTLKVCLINQLPMQVEWEMMVRKLSYLHDECELEMESAYAAAFKNEMSNPYAKVSTTEAKEFAKADPTYQQFRRALNSVKQVRDEARGCLDTVQSRKYTCNSLTNAIVAGVDSTIL